MPSPTLKSPVERAAAILGQTGYLVILSGAGVSKESGIPTFREAQTGLWAQYDAQELATPEAFGRNPELVWGWYGLRRRLIANAQPNAGHRALAELEGLVPRMVVLTQNVDGLHRAAGNRDVVELHGSIARDKCSASCRGDPTVIDTAGLGGSPPGCPHCGAPVRPDVVWFGEALPEAALGRAFRASEECDAMLVVGTSGAVYPAAALPAVAREAGHPIIEVNPEPSGITRLAEVFLQGPSGVTLPLLVKELRRLRYPG